MNNNTNYNYENMVKPEEFDLIETAWEHTLGKIIIISMGITISLYASGVLLHAAGFAKKGYLSFKHAKP